MAYETNQDKVDAIDEQLDAGVAKVTTDGQTVEFVDPGELRKRKRELKPTRRPVAASIDLGGF